MQQRLRHKDSDLYLSINFHSLRRIMSLISTLVFAVVALYVLSYSKNYDISLQRGLLFLLF